MSKTCPTCESPEPHLHPAVQHEGEVSICPDAWHSQPTNRTSVAASGALGAPPEPRICNWMLEDDGEYYDTQCGYAFQTFDGSPLSNGLRFCAYCGGTLHVGPFKASSYTPMQRLIGSIPAEESDEEFEVALANLREPAPVPRLEAGDRLEQAELVVQEFRLVWGGHSRTVRMSVDRLMALEAALRAEVKS